DGIDILVDLSAHMGRNRIFLFALKPAPVQVSHIGYPPTTGLPTMDYRITDPYLDPPGLSEAYNTEQLVRLPRCWYCYVRPEERTVQPPRVLRTGRITLGRLNSLAKVRA